MRKRVGIIVLSALIIVSVIVFALTKIISNNSVESVAVNIYYLDHLTNELKSEKRTIPTGDHNEMLETMMTRVKESPQNKKLTRTKPENVKLLNAGLVYGDTLETNFSKEYWEMSSIQELFFRASFVWTMTELHFIDQVKIMVEGEELTDGLGRTLGYLTRENTVIQPIISPLKEDEAHLAILYYTDSESQQLITEQRYISVNPDKPVEYFIVEQLVAGPKEDGNYPVIPADTKIREVKTEQGTCYIDLSSEFLLRQAVAPGSEKLTVYSIVNSITELPDINYVQIFINSRKDDIKKGEISLENPFERDESLIK